MKTKPSGQHTRIKNTAVVQLADTVDDEGRYRSFIENLPVLFYAVQPDPPFTPIYVSPAFSTFGYSMDEWLRDPDIWLRVIHPEDLKWVFEETTDSTAHNGRVEYVYRVITADGSVRWVRDRGCLIKDSAGNVVHRQGVISDITESRKANDELLKREKLYRTLAKNIPDAAVLLFDHDLRFTLADGEQLRSHGYTSEMFENKTIWEVLPKKEVEEWIGFYHRALAGETVRLEQNRDGKWFQIYFLPVWDENSEIFSGMVMWQDITERKRFEEDLKESEARYRNLFENASDVIYVHDLDGNYISINHAAEKTLGYSRDEACTMNMVQIAAPEHLATIKQKLEAKVTGRDVRTAYEVDCVAKDGRRMTLEINSSIISKDGVPVAVQGIARDITK
ncbi:MAG: PAS domain S-box protein, partial [Acidobacteriota bacterium]